MPIKDSLIAASARQHPLDRGHAERVGLPSRRGASRQSVWQRSAESGRQDAQPVIPIFYLFSHVSSPFLWLVIWIAGCSVYLLWKRVWSPRGTWLMAVATLLLALLSTPAASSCAGDTQWHYPPENLQPDRPHRSLS